MRQGRGSIIRGLARSHTRAAATAGCLGPARTRPRSADDRRQAASAPATRPTSLAGPVHCGRATQPTPRARSLHSLSWPVQQGRRSSQGSGRACGRWCAPGSCSCSEQRRATRAGRRPSARGRLRLHGGQAWRQEWQRTPRVGCAEHRRLRISAAGGGDRGRAGRRLRGEIILAPAAPGDQARPRPARERLPAVNDPSWAAGFGTVTG